MSNTLTLGRTETEVTTSDGSEKFEDWFCVSTKPFDCPCGEYTAYYMTAMHLILVWPTMDDHNMLDMCSTGQKEGRNPKVMPYKSEYGKCVSYYEVIANPNIRPHVGV